MKIVGIELNGGDVEAEAFVLDFPFSFIGDFDPDTGCLLVKNHALSGQSMAGKILVFPHGRGGTMGPFILYRSMKNGTAPVAILCNKADPIIFEGAAAIDIPIFDQFSDDIIHLLKSGQHVRIKGGEITV